MITTSIHLYIQLAVTFKSKPTMDMVQAGGPHSAPHYWSQPEVRGQGRTEACVQLVWLSKNYIQRFVHNPNSKRLRESLTAHSEQISELTNISQLISNK